MTRLRIIVPWFATPASCVLRVRASRRVCFVSVRVHVYVYIYIRINTITYLQSVYRLSTLFTHRFYVAN